MPSTPAPAVAPASTSAPAGSNDLSTVLQPGQVVYAPRLPTPEELTAVAQARGYTVARIEQAANQVTVAYDLPGGQRSVVAYVLLSSAATAGPIATTPAPTVIYAPARRVVYYDPVVYDPWYYYSPVALSIGLGFGHYHGGWYGGGHGGWRGGGHHGGWHR